MPPNWPTYAWYTTAAILGIVGTLLLIKWLIGDRSKGRRRCPKCWYDMSATPGMTCSECGHTPRRESRLFRTRRHSLRLILSVLAAIAAWASLRTPAATHHSWPAYIPTTALLLLVDPTTKEFSSGLFAPTRPTRAPNAATAAPPPPNMTAELARRFATGPMWHWQWRSISLRLIPTESDLSSALSLRVYPSLSEPYCLGLARSFHRDPSRQSLVGLLNRRVIARPRVPEAREYRLLDVGHWTLPPSFVASHSMASPDRAAPTVTFDIFIQEQPRWFSRPVIIERATRTFPSATSPLAPILAPTSDPKLSRAIADYTFFRILPPAPESGAPPIILIHPHTCPDLADVAVEMDLTLLRAGQVIAAGRALRHHDNRCTLAWTSHDAQAAFALDDPGLVLRVTGNTEVSVCVCRFQRAWVGSFEVPFASLEVIRDDP